MHILEKRKTKTNNLKCYSRQLENEKDLKGIMESKMSHAEKDKYRMVSLLCGILKKINKINNNNNNTKKTLIVLENKLMVAKEEEGTEIKN